MRIWCACVPRRGFLFSAAHGQTRGCCVNGGSHHVVWHCNRIPDSDLWDSSLAPLCLRGICPLSAQSIQLTLASPNLIAMMISWWTEKILDVLASPAQETCLHGNEVKLKQQDVQYVCCCPAPCRYWTPCPCSSRAKLVTHPLFRMPTTHITINRRRTQLTPMREQNSIELPLPATNPKTPSNT